MKRLLTALLLAMLVLSGCAKKEEAPAEPEATILIKVNTEGIGCIEVAEGEETPVIDKEFPAQSFGSMFAKGTKVTMLAYESEDNYHFVKWTKNGEDYATDEQITVTVEEEAEYVAVFMLSGEWDGPTAEKIEDAKTMGDILGLPMFASSSSEEKVVQVFELNGVQYRAVALLPEDVSKALWALDFSDPDYENKFNELVAPLEIDHIVDLSAQIPAQEELDKNIGKTGEELVNEGWKPDFVNYEEKTAGMNYGYYYYTVGFEGDLVRNDDAEIEDLIKDLKAVSITYEGIGQAADPELD